MIEAVISYLLKTNVLARLPVILLLVVTGTAGSGSGMLTVLEWVNEAHRSQRAAQLTSDLLLHSRDVYADLKDWRGLPGIRPASIDDETLWLARCIFSETKDPAEMELVAWVVRNRVDSEYRGRRTYQDVILDPYQFSAFNPSSSTRYFYSHLKSHSRLPGWSTALRIAYTVRTANNVERPFSIETRHFYSERSMIGRSHPLWVEGLDPIEEGDVAKIDEKRFRFYEGVS